MNYWKPCSFQEFMEAFSYSIHKGKRKPTNMFSSMKEIIRKYGEQEAKIKAAILQFDEQEVKNMEKKCGFSRFGNCRLQKSHQATK